jgi:uncharacterized protein DUF3429
MTLIASEPAGDDHGIPEVPLALGLLGLAPFIGLALCVALRSPSLLGVEAATALLGYGAVILSFLGGTHWGLALRLPARDTRALLFIASAAPPLWAWGAVLVGGAGGLAMIAAGLLAQGAADGLYAGRFAAPRWYGRHRLALATLAAISTAAAAVVVGFAG